MSTKSHNFCEIRKIADFPLLITGFIAPYIFLFTVLLEKDYQLYERFIGFISHKYGVEFLLVHSDLTFLIIPFIGLLIALISKILICKGQSMLNFIGYVSVRINFLFVGIYTAAVAVMFFVIL